MRGRRASSPDTTLSTITESDTHLCCVVCVCVCVYLSVCLSVCLYLCMLHVHVHVHVRACMVHDIIVEEGGGVNHLCDFCQALLLRRHLPSRRARLCHEQHKRRPKPLAGMVEEVPRYIVQDVVVSRDHLAQVLGERLELRLHQPEWVNHLTSQVVSGRD